MVTVLVARRWEKLQKLAQEIQENAGRAFVVTADVSSIKSAIEMVRAVQAKFGRIDILYNNAGISHLGSIEGANFLENTSHMLNVDFLGSIRTT